jgi:recombination protein RecT
MSTQAVAKATPAQLLNKDLERAAPEWAKALPSHIPLERFKRVVQSAVSYNPDLMGVDRRSLLLAATRAAQDGLLPDNREAALVIFSGKAQYMPMIGGLLKLVRNSGQLKSLDVLVVRDGDEFDYWIDEDGTHLKHRPNLDETGNVTHAYAIARTVDGGRYIEVMSKTAIEKVRNVSRAKGSGPWVQWWDEMAKKTVLRRLIKRLPMSTDLDIPDDEMDAPPVGMRVVSPEAEPEVVAEPVAPQASKLDRFAAADVVDPETGEVVKDEDDGA